MFPQNANPLLIEVSELGLARISGSWNREMGSKSKHSIVDISSVGSNVTRGTGKQPSTKPVKLLAGKNVIRPQIKFRNKIDNSINPFMPRLTEKPHAKKPLSILIEYDDDGTEFYRYMSNITIDSPKENIAICNSEDYMLEKCSRELNLFLVIHIFTNSIIYGSLQFKRRNRQNLR